MLAYLRILASAKIFFTMIDLSLTPRDGAGNAEVSPVPRWQYTEGTFGDSKSFLPGIPWMFPPCYSLHKDKENIQRIPQDSARSYGGTKIGTPAGTTQRMQEVRSDGDPAIHRSS